MDERMVFFLPRTPCRDLKGLVPLGEINLKGPPKTYRAEPIFGPIHEKQKFIMILSRFT